MDCPVFHPIILSLRAEACDNECITNKCSTKMKINQYEVAEIEKKALLLQINTA